MVLICISLVTHCIVYIAQAYWPLVNGLFLYYFVLLLKYLTRSNSRLYFGSRFVGATHHGMKGMVLRCPVAVAGRMWGCLLTPQQTRIEKEEGWYLHMASSFSLQARTAAHGFTFGVHFPPSVDLLWKCLQTSLKLHLTNGQDVLIQSGWWRRWQPLLRICRKSLSVLSIHPLLTKHILSIFTPSMSFSFLLICSLYHLSCVISVFSCSKKSLLTPRLPTFPRLSSVCFIVWDFCF